MAAASQQAMQATSPVQVKCPHCPSTFSSYDEMDEHMAHEFALSGWRSHLHCTNCKKPFPTCDALDRHLRTNHPQDQDLECPACHQHFVRLTDVARHIEEKKCIIDSKKLDEVREQKLWFARELQARHFGDYDEAAEAGLMSHNSALRPKAEATVRPYPVQFEVHETDSTDVYAYYQNVIHPARHPDAKLPSPSKPLPRGPVIARPFNAGLLRQPVPNKQNLAGPSISLQHSFMKAEGPEKLDSPKKVDSPEKVESPEKVDRPAKVGSPKKVDRPEKVDSLTKPGEVNPGVSLLEDFVPAEHHNLQLSLIDYLDAGGTGEKDHWSVFFNPWDDGLTDISRAASPRSSSTVTIVRDPLPSTDSAKPRAFAPTNGPQTLASSKSAQDLTPTKSGWDLTPTKASYSAFAKPSEVRSRTTTPQALTPKRAHQATHRHTRQSSRVVTITPLNRSTSQALTPTKTSGAAITPTKQSAAAISAQVPQDLTPTKAAEPAVAPSPQGWRVLTPPGASGPPDSSQRSTALSHPQDGNEPPMADFDAVKESITALAALHNPKNPNFNAEKYWEPLVLKYKCPMPQCFKSFKKRGQFVHHLHTHMQEKKCSYPCPGCKNRFDSLTSLIAHTESQSVRCNFRHSKNYGIFISQAMAGMVDVVGENLESSTVQFAVSRTARRTFGAQVPDDDSRAGRDVASKPATAALDDMTADEKEEESRKMWDEHERMVEAQKAREREAELAAAAKESREKMVKERPVGTAQEESARLTELAQGLKINEKKAGKAPEERVYKAETAWATPVSHTAAKENPPARQSWATIPVPHTGAKEIVEGQMHSQSMGQQQAGAEAEQAKKKQAEDDRIKMVLEQEKELMAALARVREERQKIEQQRDKGVVERQTKQEQGWMDPKERLVQEMARQAREAGQKSTDMAASPEAKYHWW